MPPEKITHRLPPTVPLNLGGVKETDFPSAHAETYIYDAIGNLTSTTDRNGSRGTQSWPVLRDVERTAWAA